MQTQEIQPVSPYRAAWDCGRFVAYAAAVLIAGGAAVSKVRQEFDLIAAFITAALSHAWGALLWALTCGGSFWGSVTVAGVAMAAVTWAQCVRNKLRAGRGAARLRVVCIVSALLGTAVWLILAVALLRMGSDTPYQDTALFVVCAGFAFHMVCSGVRIAQSLAGEDTGSGRQHADALSVENRLAFAARLKVWGLCQWERERVMAVFNTSGEVAAITAARRYSKNVPE